jgi:hypothetical protein
MEDAIMPNYTPPYTREQAISGLQTLWGNEYKPIYVDWIMQGPDFYNDPKNFENKGYTSGTWKKLQQGVDYLNNMYGVPQTGTTTSMPMIPLNSTTNTGQAITQTMNEFGDVSSNISGFTKQQSDMQQQYYQLLQLLAKLRIYNMLQPKQTGNPFLDMITHYTYARQRTQPDYQFQGLLGKYLANKYTPVEQPIYGPPTEQEFNRQQYTNPRFTY